MTSRWNSPNSDARAHELSEPAPRDFGHRALRHAILLAAGVVMPLLSGCADESDKKVVNPREGTPAPVVAPAPKRGEERGWEDLVLWARPGQPLVVPIDPPSTAAILEGFVPASVGGKAVQARLARLVVQASDSPALRRAERWLEAEGTARVGQWATLPAGEKLGDKITQTGGVSTWVAVVDIPAGMSPGEGIAPAVLVDGRNVQVGWGEDPAPGVVGRMGERREASEDAPFAGQVLGVLRRSPMTRWQARLCAGEAVFATLAAPGDRFDDPVLEALARQVESRWHAALGAVEARDAAVCAQLRRVLGRVVEFPGGVKAPMPASAGAAGALLSQLSRARGGEVVSVARAWLADQGGSAAWVMDDAPAADAGGGGLVRIGAVNLSDREVAVSVRSRDARAPEAMALAGMSASVLTLAFPPVSAGRQDMIRSESMVELPTRAAAVTPVSEIEARVGEWRGTLSAVARSMAARPPGVEIGPGLLDFSAALLLTGRSAVDAEHGFAGRLTRDPELPSTGDVRDGWMVYVECRVPTDAASERQVGADDRVVVRCGPTDRPLAVLTLMSDGRVFAGAGAGLSAEAITRVRVGRRPGVWSASVALPSTAFETIGQEKRTVLRLTVERTDDRGVRTSWPRAQLPWQDGAGRALIDVSAWDAGGTR